MAKTTIRFELEKETKNTIRFKEVVEDLLDTPKVGTIYVPKQTLKEIEYKPGSHLLMDIYTK